MSPQWEKSAPIGEHPVFKCLTCKSKTIMKIKAFRNMAQFSRVQRYRYQRSDFPPSLGKSKNSFAFLGLTCRMRQQASSKLCTFYQHTCGHTAQDLNHHQYHYKNPKFHSELFITLQHKKPTQPAVTTLRLCKLYTVKIKYGIS